MSHAFISTAGTIMSSLYRDAKDGETIGITVENKHINELEIKFKCVIITFNHGFSVFNVCCSLRLILIPSASPWALISTSGRNKR